MCVLGGASATDTANGGLVLDEISKRACILLDMPKFENLKNGTIKYESCSEMLNF